MGDGKGEFSRNPLKVAFDLFFRKLSWALALVKVIFSDMLICGIA
jgi:hypothetical protein